MTESQEMIETLLESFRNRSFETRSSRISDNIRPESFRCQWKSDQSKIRAEIYQEDANRVLLNSILVEKNLFDRSAEYLQHAATAIVRSLIYLPHSFRIIELDALSNAVLLRSAHPESQSAEMSYFEIILKHGAWFGQRNVLTFKKYETHHNLNEARTITPFLLSKVQTQRVLGDFLEIL